MPPSTMRQITILQLGPTEMNNLREGELLRIPISPSMGLLLQEDKAELYVSLTGIRKPAKREITITTEPKALKAPEPFPTPKESPWSREECSKVLEAFDKLDKNVGGIGKRLIVAQNQVLPINRHRKFSSTGVLTLSGIRSKAGALKYEERVLERPAVETPLTFEHECLVLACRKKIKTRPGLAGHMIIAHGKRIHHLNAPTTFQCKECRSTKQYKTWKEFRMHLKERHG